MPIPSGLVNSDFGDIASKLQLGTIDPDFLERLKEELRLEDERRNGRRMRSFFPDEGPFRRELYPKHMALMAAGKIHRERAFVAGNRCLTPWTTFETGRATRQIVEMLGETAFDVQAWDGGSRRTSQGEGVFLKSIAPAFRVYLDSGSFFDCTRTHRVLTTEGYLGLDQIVRLSSGRRYWRTPKDSQASCGTDGYRGDAQPCARQDNDREQPPVAFGVPPLVQRASRADEVGHTQRCIQTSSLLAHPSIQDDPQLVSDLCAQFLDPTSDIDVRWPTQTRQAASRSVRASVLLTRDESGQRLCTRVEDLWETESLYGSRTRGTDDRLRQGVQQSQFRETPAVSWQEFLESDPLTVMFCSSSSPALVGGERIQCVIPIGCQPIVDFTVPRFNCYHASGVVHHNTGKSECASFELTCHLTGWYPHWWEGKRFELPIKSWAAGDTTKTVREIVQVKLAGDPGQLGTGMIPKESIHHISHKTGSPGAIDTIWVKHKSGKLSTVTLKSYAEGRESFQGTSMDMIWLDEEPPMDIYTECVMRTMTTDGLILMTFTPLQGLTRLIAEFFKSAGTSLSDLRVNPNSTQ